MSFWHLNEMVRFLVQCLSPDISKNINYSFTKIVFFFSLQTLIATFPAILYNFPIILCSYLFYMMIFIPSMTSLFFLFLLKFTANDLHYLLMKTETWVIVISKAVWLLTYIQIIWHSRTKLSRENINKCGFVNTSYF